MPTQCNSPMQTPRPNPSSLLAVNLSLIKDRKDLYGNNFPKIAEVWNVFLDAHGAAYHLSPEDVAMMFALMKVTRIAACPDATDSMVDLTNYVWIAQNYDEYQKL